jgi:hypothetical protein
VEDIIVGRGDVAFERPLDGASSLCKIAGCSVVRSLLVKAVGNGAAVT